MRTYKDDYNFGKEQEDLILPLLEAEFKDNIKKSEERYSKYDYSGDKYLYELKSRTNNYSKYPTTLLPADKILKNKKQIFIFNFTDQIGYIEYSKDKFSNFKLKSFIRNWRAGGKIKEKNYFYIPIEELNIIKKISN